MLKLALGALIGAALLEFAPGVAVAGQGNNLPAPTQATAAEVNALIRQVLADRIAAKDIPGYGLLRGAKRIAVRSDRVGPPLGQDALPAVEGYELRLVATEEAQAEAERTQTMIHFIAIDKLWIGGQTARFWIGVDFAMPRDPKLVKMCCCSRLLQYRRVEDRWVFDGWGEVECF